MEKENKILIFRTSITQRRDIKRIGAFGRVPPNRQMECGL